MLSASATSSIFGHYGDFKAVIVFPWIRCQLQAYGCKLLSIFRVIGILEHRGIRKLLVNMAAKGSMVL
jgi:hypothetical protein